MKSGDRVGEVVIEREVGHGSAGTAYMARDGQQRTVWVEEVAAEVAYLIQSAYGARRVGLDHSPGVRGVESVVVDGARGVLVWGSRERTLSELIEQPQAFVTALADAAEVVGRAHARGRVHGWLRPSSVLVGEQGVAVADFGVAEAARRLTRGTWRARVQADPDGARFLPEGERDGNTEATQATDLYALGAILAAGGVEAGRDLAQQAQQGEVESAEAFAEALRGLKVPEARKVAGRRGTESGRLKTNTVEEILARASKVRKDDTPAPSADANLEPAVPVEPEEWSPDAEEEETPAASGLAPPPPPPAPVGDLLKELDDLPLDTLPSDQAAEDAGSITGMLDVPEIGSSDDLLGDDLLGGMDDLNARKTMRRPAAPLEAPSGGGGLDDLFGGEDPFAPPSAPLAAEPATPQPATPQPATPQPAAPQPATPQPAAPEPGPADVSDWFGGGGGDPFAPAEPAAASPPPSDDPFGGDPFGGGGGDPFADPFGEQGSNQPAPSPAAPAGGDDPFADPFGEQGSGAGDDPFAGDPFGPGGGGAPAPSNDPFGGGLGPQGDPFGGDPFGQGGAAPSPSNDPFGAPEPAAQGGNPFGGPQPGPGGNPFGGPQQGQGGDPFGGGQGGDPFGGPQQGGNPFGQPGGGNPFGGPPPQGPQGGGNPFGGPPPGDDPFGGPQPGGNPFGGPEQGGNPFGGPQPGPGSDPFGGPQQGGNPFGDPQQGQGGDPFGGPPQQGGDPFGGPQQGGNPFGGPPQQGDPFGQPGGNPFGDPQQGQGGNPFGPPPQQGQQGGNPFGPPPQQGQQGENPFGPPPQQGQQGGNPFGGPPQQGQQGGDPFGGNDPFGGGSDPFGGGGGNPFGPPPR